MIKSWKGEEQQKLDLVFGGEISTLFLALFIRGSITIWLMQFLQMKAIFPSQFENRLSRIYFTLSCKLP